MHWNSKLINKSELLKIVHFFNFKYKKVEKNNIIL
jgi:hypothetical protein